MHLPQTIPLEWHSQTITPERNYQKFFDIDADKSIQP